MKKNFQRRRRGFTLIEIMVVVGIMGLIAAMGIPSILRMLQREGMRKAVHDLEEVCSNARGKAIFSGEPVYVEFHPNDGVYSIGGAPVSGDGAQSGTSAKLPENIAFEMLDINLSEYRESEWARVKFYPNGTSDEMTVIFLSDKNERRMIQLEVTTGLLSDREVK